MESEISAQTMKEKQISQMIPKHLYIQKIDQLTQEESLQNILIKIWKLMMKIQYGLQLKAEQRLKEESAEKSTIVNILFSNHTHNTSKATEVETSVADISSIEPQMPTLPLKIDLYLQCIPLFKKVLGLFAEKDDLIARPPEYKNSYIFLDRFCFDFISMLGKNIFKLGVVDIEYILRKAYLTLSHSFGPKKGGIQLLDIDSIVKSPFSAETLNKVSKKASRDFTKYIESKLKSNNQPEPTESSRNIG